MRRLIAILPAFLAGLLQGCVPGVGWLPDSSGFVYTTSKGHLVVYDLATKKNRVILRDPAAATTCWPAVSPGGKRIALAHLQDSDDKKDALLQFVICDLQGRVEFRSAKFKLLALTGKELEYTTQAVWSPDEKKLLVHGQGHANQGNSFNCAALFDIEARKVRVWDQHVPAYFGGSPIRPDGAGFLLGKMQSNDGVAAYAWVDWNGEQKKIPVTEVTDEPVPPYPALLDSRWDGTRAIVTLPDVRYVIDTQKLRQTMEEVRKVESMIGKEFVRMRLKLANGLELLLLDHDDGAMAGPALRVAARKKGNAALTEVIPAIRDRLILLNPSPDGKHAIVRVTYGYRGAKGDTIFVLNGDGRVQDTVEVFEKFVEKQ